MRVGNALPAYDHVVPLVVCCEQSKNDDGGCGLGSPPRHQGCSNLANFFIFPRCFVVQSVNRRFFLANGKDYETSTEAHELLLECYVQVPNYWGRQ
eukprot:scaffold1356_cov123-Cylindrotheca_fusiformis.AAC.45